MLASAPFSSPSHFAGTGSTSAAAPADTTVSRFQLGLVAAAIVAIGVVVIPSIAIPAVVVLAVGFVAWRGLQGAGQALEPIAEGRTGAAAASAIVNLNFTR